MTAILAVFGLVLTFLVGALKAVTATITRSVTIGGKAFSDTVPITGDSGIVKEIAVAAALAGTSTAQAQSNATISGATNSTGVTTVTTSSAHGLTQGQLVTISSVVGATQLNGDFVVASIVDSTHFTVALATMSGYSSGGTVVSYNTITVPNNTITATSRVDVFYGTAPVSCVRGMTASKVIGNAIGLTGGAGSSFPSSNGTVVQAAVPYKIAFAVTAADLQCLAMYTNAQGQFDFTQSDGSTEVYSPLFQTTGYVHIYDNQGSAANPFGSNVGYVYMSHNNTTASQLMRAGAITQD